MYLYIIEQLHAYVLLKPISNESQETKYNLFW